MKDGQQQIKQNVQKQHIEDDLISALEQQMETEKFQPQNDTQRPQISEHLSTYQLYVTNLSNIFHQKPKNQIPSPDKQKSQTTIFSDLWEKYKFNPTKFFTSLTANSIKYEPYSKPFFSQSFFVSKSSQNGSFLTLNLSISVFVMKLYILMEPNFIISESIFEDWQAKQLKYLDSGSFSDIFEYYDPKTKDNIVIKRINFSKAMQVTIQTIVYEYAFLKLAGALGIGLEIRPVFGFDLIFRKQYVLFGMQKGYKSYQTSIDNNKLCQDILSSLILLHSLNIAHCDIRPQNIEYSNRLDRYVLIDYGLSESLDQGLGYKNLVSNFKGTYHYSSVQMQKLFFSQNKYVDMYFNDIHCLKKTIDEEMDKSQAENLQLMFNIIGEKGSHMNIDKRIYLKKQGQKSIDDCLIFLNNQPTKSEICILSVLQTVFHIYKMDRQILQNNFKTLNQQQILLVIKAFYDLEIDDQYSNVYTHCLDTIKTQSLKFVKIEDELNKIKNKTFSQKLQVGKGILLLLEKLQKSHFYFDGAKSYLIQLWNFYQASILQDFLNSYQTQQYFSSFLYEKQIPKQDQEEKILKRKYKYKELKPIKISRIFFMFFKEMQRSRSNKRLQTMLLSQFCLHYLQTLTKMFKKLQLDSFLKNQGKPKKQSQLFCQDENKIRKIIYFFIEIKEMCQKLIGINEEIFNYFFDRTNLSKQNEKAFHKEDDLSSSHTGSSTPTILRITTQQLTKMLRPASSMMNESQKKISTEVHKIFIKLFNMYIELTGWQIKFNLQYYQSPPQRFPSNEDISHFNIIQFNIFNLNRSRKSLIVMTLILFVLAKIFYQGSAFIFQQKYELSISVIKSCSRIVTLFIETHYNMIIKFEQNKPLTKVQNHQEYIDIGGFRKFEQKIIQCIENIFQSYSMILDFIIEQDLQDIDCVIEQNVSFKFDKIKIYRQFKTFYKMVCGNIKFYSIFKKKSKNQPGVIFVDKDNFTTFNFDTKQTFSLLNSYFQEFHSYEQPQILINQKNTKKYSVCLSTFYNVRFLLVCQQITLFLESLELKIKTNLKFPLKQKQFYQLFKKIQKLQSYDRKQEQKLCVILRYVDYLFLQQKNICAGIQVLEEINECINRKQLTQIDDRFFKIQTKRQKIKFTEPKNFKIGTGKKKGSFNYLVIEENLKRVYSFMKSDKLKGMKMSFCNIKDKLSNIKEKIDQETDQTSNMRSPDKVERLIEVTDLTLRPIIQSINILQIKLKKEFKQYVKQIVEMRMIENQSMKSSSNVEVLKREVGNAICRIKYELNRLNDLVQHNRKNSPKSWKRSFIEQFFQFLSFLNFNSELVMEKLWFILSKIRKNTQKITKIEQLQIYNLKDLTKFILDIYLKECAIFSTQVDQRCNFKNGKHISTQTQLNHIEKNDHSLWLRLKEIVERKSQLIRKVFTLVIAQKQSDWLQNFTLVKYDQDGQQMIGYYIDFLYYGIKYAPECHVITNELKSISLQDTTLSKIVNCLLSYKLHMILSSKKEYIIFTYYLRLKLILFHQIAKNTHIITNQISQSNQKSLLIFDLTSLIYKLTQFLTSIQSFPFTQSFIKFIKDIASTSTFIIFLFQLISILLHKNTSIHSIKIFIDHDLFVYQLKNDMYFLTFCFQGILDCQNLQNLISECLTSKNKMTNQEIITIKSIFQFFKLFARAFQVKFDSSHESLKKYLIQKRQICKFFLITSMHGKFFHFIEQNNQIQPTYQLRSSKKSKDRKRIIINSFRKIKQYKLYLEIEQKINIKMQKLTGSGINEKLIKFLTSKLEQKYKQWQQINNLTQ